MPTNLLKQYSTLTINSFDEVLQCNTDALSGLKKKYGQETVLSVLNLLLIDTITFFSVGKSSGKEQVKETSRLILKEFYYLKIEDFKFFFDRFKLGQYGQLFDRVDGNVILVALRVYSEERMEFAENLNNNLHRLQKEKEENEIYLIRVGENYVRSCGDDFEETDKRELATAYTYGVAIKLKCWIVKDYYQTTPNAVKIENKNKPKESFFDYLEHNKPELLPQGERFKRATNEYYTLKEKILADESLTTFEKENAVRRLAGVEPLTIEEYNHQQTVYCLNK